MTVASPGPYANHLYFAPVTHTVIADSGTSEFGTLSFYCNFWRYKYSSSMIKSSCFHSMLACIYEFVYAAEALWQAGL